MDLNNKINLPYQKHDYYVEIYGFKDRGIFTVVSRPFKYKDFKNGLYFKVVDSIGLEVKIYRYYPYLDCTTYHVNGNEVSITCYPDTPLGRKLYD